jgi:hypothetical protein
MFKWLKKIRQEQRANRALVAVVEGLKAEQEMMLNDILLQVSARLSEMSPEERQVAIEELNNRSSR